jgi:glycosyltransferase involved in cell wall biosynthesis
VNVLYFHQHFSIPIGPGGIRSYCMARALVERGHSVTMVCGSFNGNCTGVTGSFENGQRRGIVDGINVIEFDLVYSNSDSFISRIWTFFKYVLRSLILIFKEKYDVVFATTTPLTAGIPGIVARHLRRKPFIFEVRDLWPELPKAMGVITNPVLLTLMSALEWLSYHSADHLIALSPGIADGIKMRGIDADLITLIPNGCDLNIFDNSSELWRPKVINNVDFLAIFTGTHGVANGLHIVLDAAAELSSRKRNDIKIMLVGSGRLKASLVERVDRDGLRNVVFHEPVNKKELSGLMSSADIGLQVLANVKAFYYGTSPNKFFDYIAAGLPVLINYPGWIADIVTKNNAGFVVPPEDAISFAEALERAADNRVDLKAKGLNSKRLAIQDFDRKAQSSDWVDVLELTLSNTERK